MARKPPKKDKPASATPPLPTTAPELRAAVGAALEAGDNSRAIAALEALIALQPDEPGAYHAKACCQSEQASTMPEGPSRARLVAALFATCDALIARVPAAALVPGSVGGAREREMCRDVYHLLAWWTHELADTPEGLERVVAFANAGLRLVDDVESNGLRENKARALLDLGRRDAAFCVVRATRADSSDRDDLRDVAEHAEYAAWLAEQAARKTTESARDALARLERYIADAGHSRIARVAYGPPFTPTEVATIERAIAAPLPASYATFVTQHGPFVVHTHDGGTRHAMLAAADVLPASARAVAAYLDAHDGADATLVRPLLCFQHAQFANGDYAVFDARRALDGEFAVEALFHDDEFAHASGFQTFDGHVSDLVDELLARD